MDWTWRTKDPEAAREMRLLYEPGNWGDVLKGLWVAEVAAAIRERRGRPILVADPFAGAPDYPVCAGVEERVAAVSGSVFHGLQEPYLAAGRFASTTGALLGPGTEAVVFDLDEERRIAWAARDGVRILPVGDGWEAIHPDVVGASDLVVVDPYDLAREERWRAVLPRIGELACGGATLSLYLYNRGSKGPNELRDYRRFRRALSVAIGGQPSLVGRVPSDSVLPRAWHEVVLVGQDAQDPSLLRRLGALTERLALAILCPGLMERA